jgi:AAA15 family ATPase/GTPase
MLVDFRVKNYRSIKDDQTFSMVATSGNELEDTHTFKPLKTTKSLTLLRSATIYGANAAGKSNLLKSLKTMQRIVLESASKIDRGDKIPGITPFLLDTETKVKPSEFEINFIYDEVRYQYGFSATSTKVIEEWLIAYPKGRPQHWFERIFNKETDTYDWDFGDKLTGAKSLWQDATRDNALFLSTAVQLNSEKLQPIYDWFKNELHITEISGWDPEFTYSLCRDEEYKKRIMKFLNAADIDIQDISVEEKELELKKGKKVLDVSSVHLDNEGNEIKFNIKKDESDGTQKLLSFIGPWINTLENGFVLVVDELHDNFHPLIVKFLIELFNNSETNPNNAQLIFTSHETSVMTQEVFRRDQVWFCEKKDKATEIFSLVEFKPRKGVTNIEKGYFSGRYGAIPFISNIHNAMGV